MVSVVGVMMFPPSQSLRGTNSTVVAMCEGICAGCGVVLCMCTTLCSQMFHFRATLDRVTEEMVTLKEKFESVTKSLDHLTVSMVHNFASEGQVSSLFGFNNQKKKETLARWLKPVNPQAKKKPSKRQHSVAKPQWVRIQNESQTEGWFIVQPFRR